uniref:Mab-21-like nucleotidyltransferase domain-containing protein n=1 Tax=Pelusios castaneus TaxID=367368 RepID=A0A8C8S3J1_9SAUR
PPFTEGLCFGKALVLRFLSSLKWAAATAHTMPNPVTSHRIEERVKSIRLKQKEISNAADIINGFIDPFISHLKECPERPYFKGVTKVTTGSYYELVKIFHPNEFDVMLALPVPNIGYTDVEDCDGLFYKVTLQRKSRSFPTPFLLEDESTVSPVNVLKEFRKFVSQFIASHYKGKQVPLTLLFC